MRVPVAVLSMAMVAIACGQPAEPVQIGNVTAVDAQPERVPDGVDVYDSAEAAALAAAQLSLGGDIELHARAFYPFPDRPDEARVEVRGQDFCAVWGAAVHPTKDGWFSSGEGRNDLC